MTASPEKAAPIPEDVLALADCLYRDWCQRSVSPVEIIARAIMQDRADRASQEERIRQDEREACAMVAECAFDDRPRLPDNIDWTDGYWTGARDAAKAIRARS